MLDRLNRWFQFASRQRRTDMAKAPKYRTRPKLEMLEDRLAPAIFNVNSTADILNPGPGITTLRSAIQAANSTPGGNTINLTLAGDYRITLAPTTANESDNAAGEFAILPEGNLTIQNTSGGPVSVDGGGLARVFDINPNNTNNPATGFRVAMQGFTIVNGRAFDSTGANPDGPFASGGGIRVQGNQGLELTNMVVSNNSATADGGGIAMENTVNTPWTLSLNNTTVSNNRAGDAGGGIETDGAGGPSAFNIVTFFISNSTISGNSAVNGGGGIWLDGILNPNAPNHNGEVVSATVTAPGAGYTSAPMVLFSPAPAGGQTAQGQAFIANGIVTSVLISTAGSGYTTPPTITFVGGGTPTANAAASANLNTDSASLTVMESLISNNTSLASGQFGGGIGNAGNGRANGNGGGVNIVQSTVANNFSAGFGGGFGDKGSQDRVTATNSTFANNSAAVYGGGLQSIPGLRNNVGTTINDCTFTGNAAQALGGGIFIPRTDNFTLNNSIVATNVAGPKNFRNGAAPDIFGAAGAITSVDRLNSGNFIGIGDSNFSIDQNPSFNMVGTAAAPLNPLLGPLQSNGGPTPTEAPLPGSPVIDAGNSLTLFYSGGFQTDQRGFMRTVGNTVDIGAVEFQNNTLQTTQDRFIQALYVDNLGRMAETRELYPWETFLNSPGGSQAAAAALVVESFEARDRLVQGWYQTYLGRTAQNGEEQVWANMLQNQTDEQVLSQILGTPEFYSHAQTLGFTGTADQNYVQALYLLLLNRTPSAGEVAAWVSVLPQLGRQGVALSFLSSPEYRTIVVGNYYTTLFHRPADGVGVSGWLSTNMDLRSILIGFEASPEYFAIGG